MGATMPNRAALASVPGRGKSSTGHDDEQGWRPVCCSKGLHAAGAGRHEHYGV